MGHLAAYFTNWLEHDGKIVLIDGIKHRLSVTTRLQRYPYQAEVIDVSATCVNKTTKHYQATRRELGDDWSTDVLSSDLDLQCDILQQCSRQYV